MITKTMKVMTAMVTPFAADGTICYRSLAQLIEYLLANGTQAILVGGTTGEVATLSTQEKLELYQKTVEYVANRVPIVAGVGSNNTQTTIELIALVDQVDGIDAYLVVTPYYNRPNQAGLLAHFTTIANASARPIIMYNVPSRTAVHLDIETIMALAKHPNIIGIKDCSNLAQLAYIIEATSPSFFVYTGEDELYLPALAIGADGIISVASHIFGKEFNQIDQELAQGNLNESAALFRPLVPKIQALFTVAASPAPIKTLLNQRGIEVGTTRLPLVPCTKEESQQLVEIMNEKQ